jgi:hypothetical protein
LDFELKKKIGKANKLKKGMDHKEVIKKKIMYMKYECKKRKKRVEYVHVEIHSVNNNDRKY